jgi:hypothetical protein
MGEYPYLSREKKMKTHKVTKQLGLISLLILIMAVAAQAVLTDTVEGDLEVNGRLTINTIQTRNSYGGIWINSYRDDVDNRPEYYNDGYASLIQQHGVDGGLRFMVADVGLTGERVFWDEAIRITPDGFVGIRTVDPNCELDVAGNIMFSALYSRHVWGGIWINSYYDGVDGRNEYYNDGYASLIQQNANEGGAQVPGCRCGY